MSDQTSAAGSQGAGANSGADASGSADAAAGEKTLDELLNEFDTSETGGQQATQAPASQAGGETVSRAEFNEERAARQQTEFNANMKAAVVAFRGDLDPEVVTDDEIEDHIRGMGRRDARFDTAWLNQATNPEAFRKLLLAGGKEFAARRGAARSSSQEDRDALGAAVLASGGGQSLASGEKDWGGATDHEFDTEVGRLLEAERKAQQG